MNSLREYARQYEIAPLDDAMLFDFERYERFLLEYNQKVNLTAITEHDEILQKHFLDSLLLLKAYPFDQDDSVIDIGTGAGFPGVPLKIVRSQIRLTLLDSLAKRVAYLEQLSRLLDQKNMLFHARAEDAAHDPARRARYDVALSRALARLPALCEYNLAFLRVGGVMLAMKGPDYEQELRDAARAMREMGAALDGVTLYKLPNGNERSVIRIRKISQTPAKYPRKSVKITKTPL